MRRIKLQSLVRASLTQEQTISTEGFFGDLLSKIGELLSNRKKILTEAESKKLLADNKALILRLKETVLNPKWMAKSESKTQEIAAPWAIPGLDYNSELNKGSVVTHLEKTIPKFLHDCKAFRVLQQKYSDETNALYDHYLTDIVAAVKGNKSIEDVIANYDKKCKSIVDPISTLTAKPLIVFGNKKLAYNKKSKLVEDVRTGDSKVKALPALTKDEVVTVANMLVSLIESPLASDDGLKYIIDWEDIKFKLDKEGIPEETADNVVELTNDSVLMSRFYHQYAWDSSGTYDGIWEHQALIKRLFQLIDASIK